MAQFVNGPEVSTLVRERQLEDRIIKKEKAIHELIAQYETHFLFTLSPMSMFILKLKEILNA